MKLLQGAPFPRRANLAPGPGSGRGAPPRPGKSWPLGRQAGASCCAGPSRGHSPHSPPPPPRHQRVRAGRRRVRARPAVLQHPRQLPVCGHALSPHLPPGLQPRVRGLGAGALPPGRPPRPPSQKPQAGPHRCRLPDAGCGLVCTQHWGGRGRGHRSPPQPQDPGTQHRTHTHGAQTPGPGVRSPCGWERSLGPVTCPAPSGTQEPGLGSAVRAPAFDPRPMHCIPKAAEPPGRGHERPLAGTCSNGKEHVACCFSLSLLSSKMG